MEGSEKHELKLDEVAQLIGEKELTNYLLRQRIATLEEIISHLQEAIDNPQSNGEVTDEEPIEVQ